MPKHHVLLCELRSLARSRKWFVRGCADRAALIRRRDRANMASGSIAELIAFLRSGTEVSL